MPPRRTTLTFSSETAPDLGEAKLFVYYCCYSGQHVLTTDCDLTRAPRRKTDGAFQIDTQQHVAQLHHTQQGEEVLLKQDTGLLERQFRILVGKLPFAYRSEPNGRCVCGRREVGASATRLYSTTSSSVVVPFF